MAALRDGQNQALAQTLRQKQMHGFHQVQVERRETDKKATHAWLTHGRPKAETESIIMAAQDGVIHTRVYRGLILKQQCALSCRMCDEAIGHILSSCKLYKWSLYLERHDRILLHLVQAVMKSLDLRIPSSMRGPRGMAKSGVAGTPAKRIVIDQAIPVTQKISERKPDLLAHLRGRRLAVIFEVACAWEPLVGGREWQKREKYQSLSADLAKQWRGYTISDPGGGGGPGAR